MASVYPYAVLAAGCLINFIAVGFSVGLGVIFVVMVDEFNTGRGRMAFLQSLCLGLIFAGALFTSPFIRRFGTIRCCFFGGLLSGVSVMAAPFLSSASLLIALVGAVAGFGLSFSHLGTFVTVREVLSDKVGFGEAVLFSGAGIGSVCIPLLNGYLLQEYGWKGTFLLLSSLLLNICMLTLVMQIFKRKSLQSRAIKQMEVDVKQLNLEGKQLNLDDKQLNLEGKQLNLEGNLLNLEGKQVNLEGTQINLEGNQLNFDDKRNGDIIHEAPTVQSDIDSIHSGGHHDIKDANEKGKELCEELISLNRTSCQTIENQCLGIEMEDASRRQSKTGEELKDKIKPRCSKLRTLYNYLGFRAFRNKLFLVFTLEEILLWMCLTAMVYLLADIATEKGHDLQSGSYIVSAFSMASVAGNLISGFMTSYLHVPGLPMLGLAALLMACATLGVAFSVDFLPLILLAIVIGYMFGTMTLCGPVIVLDLVGAESYVQTLGLLFGLTGISDLVSGPLGGYFRDLTGSYDIMLYGIAFSLVCITVITWCLAWVKFKKRTKQEDAWISSKSADTYVLKEGSAPRLV